MIIRRPVIIFSLFISAGLAQAEEKKIPPCYGPDRWSATLAISYMKSAGFLKNSDTVIDNPQEMKTSLLEGRKIGTDLDPAANRANLYRQIQKIELKNNEGISFELITISETSDQECSMTSPTIILISPKLKVLNEGDSYLRQQESGLIPKVSQPSIETNKQGK